MSEGRFDAPALDEIMNAVLQRKRIQGASGSMRMESELNYPVTSSQSFVRFQLEKGRGILDSNTTLQLTAQLASARASLGVQVIPPITQGAMSWISKATLKIGGIPIALTENVNWLKSTESGNIPSDDHKSIKHYLYGNNAWFDYMSVGQSGGQNTAATTAVSQMKALGSIRLGGKAINDPDNWLYFRDNDTSTGEGKANTGNNAQCIYGGSNARWSIPLDELFPFLKDNQLPLFTMNDDVFVELVLNPNMSLAAASGECGSYATNLPDGGAAVVAAANDLSFSLDDVNLLATHLYYDDQVMDRIKQEHDTNGISFLYEDYAFAQRGVPAMGLATGEETQLLDIGGQSKVVRRMYIHKAPSGNTAFHWGVYACPDNHNRVKDAAGALTEVAESYQLEVNDEHVFTRPVDKSAALGYHYSLCAGNGDVWIPKAIYSNDPYATCVGRRADNNVAQTGKSQWMGHQMDVFQGAFAPRGFFFGRDHDNTENNGTKVGSKPIRIEYYRKGQANVGERTSEEVSSAQALTFRVWLVYERRFSLMDGRVHATA